MIDDSKYESMRSRVLFPDEAWWFLVIQGFHNPSDVVECFFHSKALSQNALGQGKLAATSVWVCTLIFAVPFSLSSSCFLPTKTHTTHQDATCHMQHQSWLASTVRSPPFWREKVVTISWGEKMDMFLTGKGRYFLKGSLILSVGTQQIQFDMIQFGYPVVALEVSYGMEAFLCASDDLHLFLGTVFSICFGSTPVPTMSISLIHQPSFDPLNCRATDPHDFQRARAHTTWIFGGFFCFLLFSSEELMGLFSDLSKIFVTDSKDRCLFFTAGGRCFIPSRAITFDEVGGLEKFHIDDKHLEVTWVFLSTKKNQTLSPKSESATLTWSEVSTMLD